MRKLRFFVFLLSPLVLLLGSGVHAAAFNPNNLIDDPVFSDTSSMTAGQIDSFLNSFPNSCISPNSGFAAIDPTGYNPSSGYQYGGFVTAGQVIYDAAQAYGINPQVLLTTLQKEQSLAAGGSNFCSNGDENKYSAAVGYGCPDSGSVYSYTGLSLYRRNGTVISSTGPTCVNSASKAGFSQQVIRGAWLLKFGQQRSEGNVNWAVIKGNWNNSDDPQTCYGGPMTQGNYQRCPSGSIVSYDGYTTIDSTSVHMDNGATAALYWYTPHFHGNQSFDTIFQNWFGSLIGSDIVRTASDSTIYLISGSNKYPIADVNVWNDFSALGNLKFVSDSYANSYTTGPILGHMIGDSGGTLYFVDANIKLPFSTCSSVADYGYSCGSTIIMLQNYQLAKLASGPTMSSLYSTTSGKNFYISTGQKHEIFDQQSLINAGISGAANSLLEGGISYLPYGSPIIRDGVVVTNRGNSQLYYYESSKYTPLSADVGNLKPFSTLARGTLDNPSIPLAQRQVSFNGFMKNSGGTANYVLTNNGKAAITSSNNWATSYTVFSDTLLNNTPNDSTPINNGLIKSPSDATVYYVLNKQKRPFPSWQDLTGLNITPLTINVLPISVVNSISTGPLMYAPGRLVKTASSPTVYAVQDSSHLIPVSSFLYTQELGLAIVVPTMPDTDFSTYTVQPSLLQTKVVCNGAYYVGILGHLYAFSSAQLSQYGFTPNSFLDISTACLDAPQSQQGISSFIRTTDGTIYIVQSGQKQAFTNYQAYLAHGGTSQNTTQVSDYFASLIASGANIAQ